jgi:hypothetical protein
MTKPDRISHDEGPEREREANKRNVSSSSSEFEGILLYALLALQRECGAKAKVSLFLNIR